MNITSTITRLLTCRLTRQEMLQFSWKHLAAGITGTWLVGMGRYWDDPRAGILQHLGLGSVIYIFLLSFFIWLIIKPYLVEHWTYFTVLTFISLTSFPAALYAVPVEKWVGIAKANTINVWFLAIVAAWRLRLLYFFVRRFTGLGTGDIVTVTLMPVCLVIAVLTMLNLHRVVFDIMGGRREQTPHDGAYTVLMILTVISCMAVVPLLVGYILGIYGRRKQRRMKKN